MHARRSSSRRSRYGYARRASASAVVDRDALVRRAQSDEPLREDVERRVGDDDLFDDAVADAAARRGRLDDVVAILRDDDARRDGARAVSRAADALQRRRHAARAAEHDHAVDVADVDAELERGRADDGAQRSRAQRGLGAVANVALERAVMHADAPVARHGLGARPVFRHGDRTARVTRVPPITRIARISRVARVSRITGATRVTRVTLSLSKGERHFFHLVRDALGLAAHVGEHERRAHVARQLVRGARALRQRRHRAGERRDDVEPHLAQAAAVDDRAVAVRPGKVRGDAFERRDGRRQTDAAQRHARDLRQRLQQQREVRAALVAGQRVHLVDDHRLDVRELLAIALHRDHQRQRLGRREQHVRRAAHHQPPLFDRRVAGAHAGAHERLAHAPAPLRRALRVGPLEDPHLAQRAAQVVLDVVAERAQRRDVEAVRPREELVGVAQAGEPRDHREKRRERLPGAGRRADQGVAALRRQGQRLRLRRRRGAEVLVAPRRDVRVQRGKSAVHENGISSSNGRSAPRRRRGSSRRFRSRPSGGTLHRRPDARCS